MSQKHFCIRIIDCSVLVHISVYGIIYFYIIYLRGSTSVLQGCYLICTLGKPADGKDVFIRTAVYIGRSFSAKNYRSTFFAVRRTAFITYRYLCTVIYIKFYIPRVYFKLSFFASSSFFSVSSAIFSSA